jgi:hypothetical protein
MGAIHVFRGSAALFIAALFAVVILHGGWEAAAAGVTIIAGFTCVLAAIALLAHTLDAPRGSL